MQPRKLLRRYSPKAGKKRAQLAKNATRKWGYFFHNSAGIVNITVLGSVQARQTKNSADFISTVEFWKLSKS